MHALRRLSPLRRRLMIVFLAMALSVRMLVPAGWMPVADAAGVSLGLCDGMTMAMPEQGPGPGAAAHRDGQADERMPLHHQGATDHPCAFAAPTATPDGPTLAMPMPAAALAPVPVRMRRLATVGHGLAAPPPPPTGPPAFA